MTTKEDIAYRKGYYDGMNVDAKYPNRLHIMGKSLDEIIELIQKDEEKKFISGEQWTMADYTKLMNRQKQKEVDNKMSNIVMYRKDAEKFLHENGWKLFVDKVIKEKLIIMEDETDIIKTLYNSNGHYMDYGTIRVEHWPEGLVLWVGGEIRWKSWNK